MHLSKNIEKLRELKSYFSSNEKVSCTILDMVEAVRCGPLTREINKMKSKGIGAEDPLLLMLLFPFMGLKSIRAFFQSGWSGLSEGGKDVFYRLKGREGIDWRRLLRSVTLRFAQLTREKGEEGNTPACLMVDDTTLEKSAPMSEGLSRVFDHVSKRYVLGYKLLTLGWWDGKSFIPLDFSFHREGKDKKRPFGLKKREREGQKDKQREEGTPGHQRKEELDKSKMDQALGMIKGALGKGVRCEYVLMDSWFFSHKMLKGLRGAWKKGVQVIAMAKMGNTRYTSSEGSFTAKEMKKGARKDHKRCREFKARYVCRDAYLKDIPVRLFLVRYAGQGNWKLMVTTDLDMSFTKMMRTYHLRWSIEVFFKEMKQYLGMGKCQCRDLDAQVADTTIAMFQYVLLSLSKRFGSYETVGGVFRAQKEEVLELTLAERIWGLLKELVIELSELLEVPPHELMEKFLREDTGTKLEKLMGRWFEETENSFGMAA